MPNTIATVIENLHKFQSFDLKYLSDPERKNLTQLDLLNL